MHSSELVATFRKESGRVISALLMIAHDFDLAEDALQDAVEQAMQIWPKKGLPNNPGAWLYTTAKRRLIDQVRSQSLRHSDKTLQTIQDIDAANEKEDFDFPDERLRLIFTCCHPALSRDASVALTLRTVCGLSTREIARAFLSTEVSMGQRLARAKKKIRVASIKYEIPDIDQLPERIPLVLAVIYFIFNESYSAFEGQTLSRENLANEAIYLAEKMHEWLPTPESGGLVALLYLHQARSSTRSCEQNEFIPLDKQNRSQWDQKLIQRGKSLLLRTLAKGRPGPYQIQAAISAVHAEAQTWDDTDWEQIAVLYAQLKTFENSEVVELNRAMALAYSGKFDVARRIIDSLRPPLEKYQPLHVADAWLHEKLSHLEEARTAYAIALRLTKNSVEKRYLQKQLNKLK